MDTIVIRQTTVEDYADGKYEILYHWLSEIDEFLLFKFAPEQLEFMKKSWMETVSQQNDRCIIFGAFAEGELVAQAMITTNKGRESHTGEWGIAVKKEFHGQGLGTRLIGRMEDHARSLGLRRLCVSVCDANEVAKAVYIRKCGYHVEGRQHEQFRLDSGTYVDMLMLGKSL